MKSRDEIVIIMLQWMRLYTLGRLKRSWERISAVVGVIPLGGILASRLAFNKL